MKKLGSILLILTLAAGAFAGCSGGGAPVSESGSAPAAGSTPATEATSPAPAETAGSTGKTTVQFWHSMSGTNGDLTNQLVADFNASQDEIEVIATFQGNYAEAAAKAEQAIFAGNSPDILQAAQDNVGRLATNGQFADLKPYLEQSGIDENDFIKAFVQDAYYDGKLVAVPYGRSAQVLHINKTILDEVGASIPTTWDELKDTAEKCVIKEGNEVKRYGITIPFDQWQMFAFIQQAGGQFFNEGVTELGFLENGIGLEVFSWLKDMQASGALYYNDQANNLDTQMFTEGLAAISIGSSGGITSRTAAIEEKGAEFEYVITPLVKGKIASMPTGGCGFGILSSSPSPDASWEFIRWFIEDEKGGLAFVIGSGYLPFTETMAASAPIQELWASNVNYKNAFDALQYGDDSYRIPNLTPVIAEFQVCIQAIMLDDQDITASLNTLNDAVKIILDE